MPTTLPNDLMLQLFERGLVGIVMLAIAIIGWFLVRLIKGMDKSIDKIGDKLEKMDEKLGEIGKLQVRVDNLEIEVSRAQDHIDGLSRATYSSDVHQIRRK